MKGLLMPSLEKLRLPRLQIVLPRLRLNGLFSLPTRFKKVGCIAVIGIAGLVLLGGISYGSFLLLYSNRIYPGIAIGSVAVGGKTPDQAAEVIARAFQTVEQTPITFVAQDRTWEIAPEKLAVHYDVRQSVAGAFAVGRSANPVTNLRVHLSLLVKGRGTAPVFTYNSAAVSQATDEIADALTVTPQSAKISYIDNQFVVGPSLTGRTADTKGLTSAFIVYATSLTSPIIPVGVAEQEPAFTAAWAEQLVPALTQYVKNPLKLRYGDINTTIDIQTLLGLIDYGQANGRGFHLSQEKLNDFINGFAAKIDRPPKDGQFRFENGKVSAFTASREGLAVDRAAVAKLLTDTIVNGGNSRVIEVPVVTTPPKTATADVNNLGINELIGHGESNFAGSPADRIFNLTLAASRINGTLLQPGQEFSFNDSVGDISAATGYKQALVILSGKTVLGDGGGVCQVSTTLFRAVLNAGLPVTKRTAHAYRVGYYERASGFWSGPGYDATIYQPGVDFKFKNDTDHAILIQSRVDPATTTISFDIYGTPDGREVAISKPVIYSTTPALPDVNIDDPNLAKGTVRQTEHSIPGAKVGFTRTVTRNGETIIQETFSSSYRPWAAVYIHGTKEGM